MPLLAFNEHCIEHRIHKVSPRSGLGLIKPINSVRTDVVGKSAGMWEGAVSW